MVQQEWSLCATIYFLGWVIAVPCSPALSLSISHSPTEQFDFDASQEGITALNDQPRVACAVHGQSNFGCDVYLYRNIQEANEAGGDQGTNKMMSHSHHQVQAHQAPVTSGFSTSSPDTGSRGPRQGLSHCLKAT